MNLTNVRKFLREAKNTLNSYSDIEILVREATSNDPWGPTTSLMRRIALECDNSQSNYHQMFKILWKRLTDFHHIKHVHKSLCLIEYLIKYGPERFVTDVRLRSDVLNKLTYYKYLKNGTEVGAEVRSKAKTILVLLDDKTLLAEHREAAISTNKKIIGFSYRDQRVDAPAKEMSLDSPSEREVALASPESEPEEFKEVAPKRAPKPQHIYTEEIPEVPQEDDLLAFARSNRRGSSNNFNASGVFSFDMPDVPARPALMFEEIFAGNEMALVVVQQPQKQAPVQDDFMLFDDAESFANVVEEEKPMEPEFDMEPEMEMDSEAIPEDIWSFANVDNIRVTNSDKKRREHLLNKKRMMKGQKLKQMDKVFKMEMDHGLPAITYGETSAVVPYGMQYQQPVYQPYQQQQLVPYGYQHAQVNELQWN